MKKNSLKWLTAKPLSLICAAVLAISVIPAAMISSMNIAAEGSKLDFQDDSAIVGNDAFSVAGIDNSNKYYFFAKNSGTESLSVSFGDITLDNGKSYTLDFDLYLFRKSTDENGALLSLGLGGDEGEVLKESPLNDDFIEEAWANYHCDFTAAEAENKLDFSLNGGGKVLIDNMQLIAEDGTVIALDCKKACENSTYPDNFEYATLYDISLEPNDDGNGYLTAAVPADASNSVSNKTIDIPMNIALPAGEYTVSFDARVLNFGSNAYVMATRVCGNGGSDSESEWYTQSSFQLKNNVQITHKYTLKKDYSGAWLRVHIYQGVTVRLDNFKVVNSLGVTVKLFDFNEPVVFSGGDGCFVQEGIAGIDETPEITGGYLKITAPQSTDTNKAYNIDIPYSKTLPAGSYTMSINAKTTAYGENYVFAPRLCEGAGIIVNPDKYYQRSSCTLDTVRNFSFSLQLNEAHDAAFLRIYVYQGVTIIFDDIQLKDGDGNIVAGFDFENPVTITSNVDYCSFGNIDDDKKQEEKLDGYLEINVPASYGGEYVNVYLPIAENNYNGEAAAVTKRESYKAKITARLISAGANANAATVSLCTSTGGASAQEFAFAKALFNNNGELNSKKAEYEVSKLVSKGQYTYVRIRVYRGVKLELYGLEIAAAAGTEAVLKTDFETEAVIYDNSDSQSGGYDYSEQKGLVPDIIVNESGYNISYLRGRAGKDGAALKIGGTNGGLALESNTSYAVSVMYYQAKQSSDTVTHNLFQLKADAAKLGMEQDAVINIKKNNSVGWNVVTLRFTTGEIQDTSADWLTLSLASDAWVYFDDLSTEKLEKDNNRTFDVIDFEKKDDTVYPADGTDFHYTDSLPAGYTSNGSNGWFYASNHDTGADLVKNYNFRGIKLDSNTSYKVSFDYYVAETYSNSYRIAFGYSPANIGSGSAAQSFSYFSNNETVVGWKTISYNITTGNVIPNQDYLKIAVYGGYEFYIDNIRIESMYQVSVSSNDSSLGTVTASSAAGKNTEFKIIAKPYSGVTFMGWYEYGDLITTEPAYRFNVTENRNLMALFSGTAAKTSYVLQSFEDYDAGVLQEDCFEMVDNTALSRTGSKVLHLLSTKLTQNVDHSEFYPLVEDVKATLKDDTEYDVYIWVKPVGTPESKFYVAITHGVMSNIRDNQMSSIGVHLLATANNADKSENGWYRYYLGTVTKAMATRESFNLQIGKFNIYSQSGATINEFYIDDCELIERVPDYASMKYTEKLYNEISNSDFESEINNNNWGTLCAGMSVEAPGLPSYDWQGKKVLKFDASKSGGAEYLRILKLTPGKIYTFAAWGRLAEGGNASIGLYSDGKYTAFESVAGNKNGALTFAANNTWTRESFTFNSGDSTEAYLVIRGTKGVLWLDQIELFQAKRGYTIDPNDYSDAVNLKLQMFSPIAFKATTSTKITYVDKIVEDETTDAAEPDGGGYVVKKRVKKTVSGGGLPLMAWVGIGAGAIVLASGAALLIILFRKRRNGSERRKVKNA